ncbi:hypothetical protein ACFE04_026645 [Oxalis oulophora]
MPGNPSCKWPPSTNVAAEELGLLRNGPKFRNSDSRDPMGPNRSRSVQPNVEGSFLAIVDEILESVCTLAQDQYGNNVTQTMVKDQFANYVIEKVLETCTDAQRNVLLSRIKVHVNALKYTYGKHIVARLEQHFGDGEKPTIGKCKLFEGSCVLINAGASKGNPVLDKLQLIAGDYLP